MSQYVDHPLVWALRAYITQIKALDEGEIFAEDPDSFCRKLACLLTLMSARLESDDVPLEVLPVVSELFEQCGSALSELILKGMAISRQGHLDDMKDAHCPSCKEESSSEVKRIEALMADFLRPRDGTTSN